TCSLPIYVRHLQKAAVDADLAELVLDQHHLLPLEGLTDQLFDQSRFACAQKAGKNIDLGCHISNCLVFLSLYPCDNGGFPPQTSYIFIITNLSMPETAFCGIFCKFFATIQAAFAFFAPECYNRESKPTPPGVFPAPYFRKEGFLLCLLSANGWPPCAAPCAAPGWPPI